MASAPTYEVVVKGVPETNKLGDCPFCHRVLLTLAAKQIHFEMTLVDFANKPAWLIAASGGKVPVLRKPGAPDFVLPDSDAITAFLEKEHPEPSMASHVDPSVGAKVFPSFRAFLFAPAGTPEEAEKRAALDAELQALNAALSQPGVGPLFGGQSLNATDAALAPKLYHCNVALRHFKGYELPEECGAVRAYLTAAKALPAWKACDYGEEMIIKGWTGHLAVAH